MATTTATAAPQDTPILITGGSGFLSLVCIAHALDLGHPVRTTVRSAAKQQQVLDALSRHTPSLDLSHLSFVHADLLSDNHWATAAADQRLILHVASPFPATAPADEQDLIRPAVDGTLRVLRAAAASKTVTRVVITSSVAAVAYGHPSSLPASHVFTEADWTDPTSSSVSAYARSKTLAERAAWDFIRTDAAALAAGLELAAVNPAGIFGPALRLPNESTTCDLIRDMLRGAMPAVPDVRLGLVDVRDAAALHLLAATRQEAAGRRFLCVAGESWSLGRIGGALKDGLEVEEAKKVPTWTLPDLLVRGMALVMPRLKGVVADLGREKRFDNAAARELDWRPRSNEEAVVSCARAWIDSGALKKASL